MRKIGLSGFLVALALLVAGCGSATPAATGGTPPPQAPGNSRQAWEIAWEKTLEEARQEGTVVAYSTAGADVRTALSQSFKQKYGINLEFVVGTGRELMEKILTERRAGLYNADFYMGGTTDVVNMLFPEGIIDPIKPTFILPEVLDPGVWYAGKYPFVDNGERLFGFRGSVFRPITVNSDLVKTDEIGSFNDLLKPGFKGKIAMGDPTIGGSAASFFTLVKDYLMGNDFVVALAKQEPFISRDERLLTEWVARGKYSILIGTKPDPIAEFVKAGAPLVSIIPKEGAHIEPGAGTICLFNKPAHPNSLKVFVNWLLGKEGQTIYARTTATESAREDVSKAHLDPKFVREPGKKYILVNEEFTSKSQQNWKLSAEILGLATK